MLLLLQYKRERDQNDWRRIDACSSCVWEVNWRGEKVKGGIAPLQRMTSLLGTKYFEVFFIFCSFETPATRKNIRK